MATPLGRDVMEDMPSPVLADLGERMAIDIFQKRPSPQQHVSSTPSQRTS